MIKFEYDEGGILHAYRDGKEVGVISTMGDDVKEEDDGSNDNRQRRRGEKS